MTATTTSVVTAGMTDAHRRVYDLIVNRHPEGLDRDALRIMSGLDDRKLRQVIEELRPVAATTPHPRLGRLVIGFDPDSQRYCAARDKGQAERILAYQHARVEALLGPLLLQLDAARASFGESDQAAAIQDRLLDAKPLLRWAR